MKRRTLLLSVLLVLIASMNVFAEDERPIRLWVNGGYRFSDVDPYIKNNRTMVPLRIITENFGYDVKWNGSSKTVTMKSNTDTNTQFVLRIGSKQLTGSSKDVPVSIPLDTAAEINANRTFVPLRAIAEAFGYPVDWDGALKTVVIGKGYQSPAVKDFNAKSLVLSVDGQSKGNVTAIARRGGIYIDYRDLAKAFNLKTKVVRDVFGTGDDDAAVKMTAPNGWWIHYEGSYTSSSDGLNFGRYDYPTYALQKNRIFVPLKQFADAKHMDLSFNGRTIELKTNGTQELYPLFIMDCSQVSDYSIGPQAYQFVRSPYFAIRYNGTRYVLSRINAEGEITDDLDFAKYQDSVTYNLSERDYATNSKNFHMQLGINNHFYLLRDEGVVQGGISD